jgi:asparagine synthase (glutamine-hydrolysing)
MCGIAGVLGDPRRLAPMLQAQGHRGPDHLGWTQIPQGALGAARLRMVGGPEADQPVFTPDGRHALVLSGEVFNHRELDAGGAGDLGGLCRRLAEEGPQAFSRVRGPFAAILLDRTRAELLVARDEVGVRPLFISTQGPDLLVASEIPALEAAAGGFDGDLEAWAHLLAFQFRPRAATLHAGIGSLPPGTWRRYGLRGGRAVAIAEGSFRYEGPRARDLGALLEEAIALQAPKGHPSALLLSGGVDSSAVGALLAAAGGKPDFAVVGWFPEAGPDLDERPHAREVAAELRLPLLEVPILADAHQDAEARLIRALGGPEAGPGGASVQLLVESAAREGARILYTGQGGDELFGGYERHRQLAARLQGHPTDPAPGYGALLRGAEEPAVELLFRGRELLPLLAPGMAGLVRRSADCLPRGGADLLERLIGFEIRTLLPGLLAVDDRAAASVGAEGRVPLLDPGLAQAAARIPFLAKSPPESPRRLFRELLGLRLPEAARRRRDKMGFPVPLEVWLAGPWKGDLSDPGLPARLGALGFEETALRRGLRALSPRGQWFLLACARALEADAAPAPVAAWARELHGTA